MPDTIFSPAGGERTTLPCDIYKIGEAAYVDAAKALVKALDKLGTSEAQAASDMAFEYKTPGEKYIAVSRGEPHGLAGLMILSSQDDCLKIEAVCAHPLSKTVGMQLIQRAVKASVDAGKGGRLILSDVSKGNPLYRSLGFTPVEPDSIKMALSPASSAKWKQEKGRFVATR